MQEEQKNKDSEAFRDKKIGDTIYSICEQSLPYFFNVAEWEILDMEEDPDFFSGIKFLLKCTSKNLGYYNLEREVSLCSDLSRDSSYMDSSLESEMHFFTEKKYISELLEEKADSARYVLSKWEELEKRFKDEMENEEKSSDCN